MFSLHQVKLRKLRQNEDSIKKVRMHAKSKSPINDPNILTEYSRQRLSDFNRSLSPEQKTRNFQKVIKKGVIPLLHPEHHSFRTKSEKANIYVKK
jgi:hypothetical protein